MNFLYYIHNTQATLYVYNQVAVINNVIQIGDLLAYPLA